MLVLWPQAQAAVPSPLALWRRWASDVSGRAIPGGHLQPEQSAQEVLAELLPFLSRR